MSKFYTYIDLKKNELRKARVENLASAPAAPVEGQIYYDTTLQKLGFYNGTGWVYASVTGINGILPIVATMDANGNVDITINPATQTDPGTMSAADKTKLDAATELNTPSTIVLRDSNGDFAAHTITADKVTGLSSPIANTDAANKAYVDATALGLALKSIVLVKTTGNITLSGIQTIDGYDVLAGNRVAVFSQNDPVENGIYVTSAGAWTRSTDYALGSNVRGSFFFVDVGSQNAATGWVESTLGSSAIVGTDSITVSQFSGYGTYLPGNGLDLTGVTFNVKPSDASLTVAPASIQVRKDPAGGIILNGVDGLKVNTDNTTVILGGNKVGTNPVVIPQKYKAVGIDIGGAIGPVAIQHDLNNRHVTYRVYDSTTGEEYIVDATATSVNVLTIEANGPTVTVTVIIEG